MWQKKQVHQQHVFLCQDASRISAEGRNAVVEDLWSLTSFFGYSTQTFVLAVNLLDRFLAMIKVRAARTSQDLLIHSPVLTADVAVDKFICLNIQL